MSIIHDALKKVQSQLQNDASVDAGQNTATPPPAPTTKAPETPSPQPEPQPTKPVNQTVSQNIPPAPAPTNVTPHPQATIPAASKKTDIKRYLPAIFTCLIMAFTAFVVIKNFSSLKAAFAPYWKGISAVTASTPAAKTTVIVTEKTAPTPEQQQTGPAPQWQATAKTLQLSGTIMMRDQRAALMNGKIYQVGDVVEGLTVQDIQLKSVTLAAPDGTIVQIKK